MPAESGWSLSTWSLDHGRFLVLAHHTYNHILQTPEAAGRSRDNLKLCSVYGCIKQSKSITTVLDYCRRTV